MGREELTLELLLWKSEEPLQGRTVLRRKTKGTFATGNEIRFWFSFVFSKSPLGRQKGTEVML